jgi:hypothetical protein
LFVLIVVNIFYFRIKMKKKLIEIYQNSGSLELAMNKLPVEFYDDEYKFSIYDYQATLVGTRIEKRYDRDPEFYFTFEITLR